MKSFVMLISLMFIVVSSPCYAWHLTADPQPVWNAFNEGVHQYEVDVDSVVYTQDTQRRVRAVDQGDDTVRLNFNLDWVPFDSGPYSIKVRSVNPKGSGNWSAVVTVSRNADGYFVGTTSGGPEDTCCLAILP